MMRDERRVVNHDEIRISMTILFFFSLPKPDMPHHVNARLRRSNIYAKIFFGLVFGL